MQVEGRFKIKAKGKSGAPRNADISKALADLDEISKKRFGMNFVSLASAEDHNKAARRTRHLIGVALKKNYSDEMPVLRKGRMVDYKWKINRAKLERMPEDAWQFTLLEQAPDKSPGETGKQVAARLRRETRLWACYSKVVHPYLCQSPEVRKKIKSALSTFGAGKLSKAASAEGLLSAGALQIACILAPHGLVLGALPFTALALCVIGLDSFCKSSDKAVSPKRRTAGAKGKAAQVAKH